ncbi:MAG: hypothetical protein LBS15_03150 [Endomicrobium sp.]|jgi:hypothetical protein|nr:hypothetical protein [Endomicrobium sp.]
MVDGIILNNNYLDLEGIQAYILRQFIGIAFTRERLEMLDIFMALAENRTIIRRQQNHRRHEGMPERTIATQNLERVEIARARQVVLNYPDIEFDDNPWPNHARVLRGNEHFDLFEAERMAYRRYLILPVEEVMALANRYTRR